MIYDDYLVGFIVEGYRVVVGVGLGMVYLLHEAVVEGVVDERGLAASGNARDYGQNAHRDIDVYRFQVVLSAPFQVDEGVALPAHCGQFYLFGAAEIHSGKGVPEAFYLFGRSDCRDTTAVDAGAGAYVDDEVGFADGVFVVFDDDKSVSEVFELLQGLDQLMVVALVKTDGGFVEDVEDAHEVGADLGCEPDSLRFSARERSRTPRQRQVSEPDFFEELQS